MILRNWYNMLKANNMRRAMANGYVTTSGATTDAGYYNSTGVIVGLAFRADNVVFNSSANGIVLGSGTTAPTLDDYKLEDQIKSGLTCSVSYVTDDNNDTSYLLTITNATDEDIVIGEIGIQSMAWKTYNSNSSVWVLVDRTVLDYPVTIPPGGIGQITYTIRLNYPK